MDTLSLKKLWKIKLATLLIKFYSNARQRLSLTLRVKVNVDFTCHGKSPIWVFTLMVLSLQLSFNLIYMSCLHRSEALVVRATASGKTR